MIPFLTRVTLHPFYFVSYEKTKLLFGSVLRYLDFVFKMLVDIKIFKKGFISGRVTNKDTQTISEIPSTFI